VHGAEGTPGAKILVLSRWAETIHVLDGYTYEDSENGYKGGLSGNPLAGSLKVLSTQLHRRSPQGATVAASARDGAHHVGGQPGVALFNDPQPVAPRTITVVAMPQPDLCRSRAGRHGHDLPRPAAHTAVRFRRGSSASRGQTGQHGADPRRASCRAASILQGSGARADAARSEGTARRVYLHCSIRPTATFPAPSTAVLPDAPGNIDINSPSRRLRETGQSTLAGIENQATSPFRFTVYAMESPRG
jgi:hypothetical protein